MTHLGIIAILMALLLCSAGHAEGSIDQPPTVSSSIAPGKAAKPQTPAKKQKIRRQELKFPPATQRGQVLKPGETPPTTTVQESEAQLR